MPEMREGVQPMVRDRETPPQADPAVSDDDAAAALSKTTGTGDQPEPGQPEQVESGGTLVRTRLGYEFHGSTVDVPITSSGVLVTAEQAAQIQAEAIEHGEVVYIGTSNQEG